MSLYEVNPVVGILVMALQAPEAQSLKDKRAVSQRLKARIRSSFNVSVAEIGASDKWQTLFLSVSVIGEDSSNLRKILGKVVELVESTALVVLLQEQIEII